MYIIEMNERLLLFGLVLFNFVIISLIVYIFVKSQKYISFLHPGWLLLLSLALYGQVTPIFVLYADYGNISNNLFLRLFEFQKFIKIYSVYTFILLLILITEYFLYFIINKQGKYQQTLNVNLSKKLSISITGFLVYIFSMIIFITDYNSILNINPDLVFNKVERIENADVGSLLSFTNLYMISFLFLFLSFFLIKNFKLRFTILLLFFISSGLIFYMGTTMQVLLMIIAFVYLGLYFKEFTLQKVVKYTVIITPIFLLLMTISEEYRKYQLNLTSRMDFLSLPDFSVFESITGYISGFILLNSTYIIDNYSLIDVFLGVIPNSILSVMNIDHTSMTVLIRDSHLASSYGTYVPTLPISIIPYLWAAIVLIPILYLVIFFIIKILTQYNLITLLISTLFYIDLFYLIRINIEDWIAKFRFDLFILLIFFLLYKLIEIFLDNYIIKRSKIL